MKFAVSTMAALAGLLAFGPAQAQATMPAAKDPAPPPASIAPAPSPASSTPAATAGGAAGGAAQGAAVAAKTPSDTPAAAEKTVDKKMAPPPKPKPSLVIDVDLARQRLTVSEHGRSAGSWAISSGRSGYRTPNGTFRPQWMARTWYSKKYDNAPMPHSIFFTGGFALHATYATGMLGRPASHGCVRQSPANASRLYAMVRKHGMDHTKIVVHGTPNFHEPAVARRDRDGERYARSYDRYDRYDQSPVRYYVRPKQQGLFSSLFGDDEPRRYYYVKPKPNRGFRGRPVYGYDEDGNRIRIR